jgi:hypothetical protein
MGFKTKVRCYFQPVDGQRINFIGDYWVRKEEVLKVLSCVETGSTGYKCTLQLRSGETIECVEDFETVILKLDGR